MISVELKIGEIYFHRNGVGGEPFHVVTFRHDNRDLIATLTDTKGGCHVIDPKDPEFMWRGDNFEKSLRHWTIDWYAGKWNKTLIQARDELNDGLTEKVY